MFSSPIRPNSVEESNQKDLQQLLANINQVNVIFSNCSDSTHRLYPYQLQELIKSNSLQLKSISSSEDAPPDENPIIKALCERDDFLTKSMFLDAILNDWFDQQTIPLIFTGRLPDDGHDAREDMFNYAQELSITLSRLGETRISPDLSHIWKAFFLTNDPKMVRGCEACPLVKNGNGYSFVSDNLIHYFIARAQAIECEQTNYSYSPKN